MEHQNINRSLRKAEINFEGERKLDIEVDGEYYHRNWDGDLCRRDQIRNQRLIELGWDVMRFWVYQIRDDMGHRLTETFSLTIYDLFLIILFLLCVLCDRYENAV